MSKIIMDKFESIINSIREILRKEGITGMDSIKHCVAFTVSRYLDKENCKKLNIDIKYSFEKIMVLIKDEEQLFELFYNQNEYNSVIGQIYEKTMFSTGFKMQSKSNLKNILNKLNEIDIKKISLSCDIVGFIYELHLKTGTSQAMRDLGQYFTNRQVIDYMVKLCKPVMHKNGLIETILDPTMGTGGFLTIATKYLNDKYKIDWNCNKKNIIGFDIDDNLHSMALLNMYLETGHIFDKTLVKRDTLHQDFIFGDKTYIDKVDIILANEPFGVKGIVYKDCCERIKNLKINGTKAEPLFLQLMMTALNENGRCAVIVPDGVLFNDANLHTNTRKYLIDNFNLQKVISLNGDFFLNTGVKSSILFFINNGKTKEVEFCDIIMENNNIIENSIVKVSLDDIIKQNYNLFVNKYNIIKETQIEGVLYMKLKEVATINFGTRIKRSEVEAEENYKGETYPCYGGGDISFYVKKYNRENINVIISRFGVSEKCVRLSNCKLWLNDSGMTLHSKNNNICIQKYLNYILLQKQKIIYNLSSGACQKNINIDDFNEIEIPIPSIDIQNQIVEYLDTIFLQIERNNKSIKAYDNIKQGIIWSNIIGCNNVKLNELLKKQPGKSLSKVNMINGEYPVIGGGEKYGGYHNEYNYDSKLLLISRVGSAGNIAYICGKCYITDLVGAYEVDENICIFKYAYYIIKFNETNIKKLCKKTAAPSINLNELLDGFYIPIPEKEIQELIVKECEYYDNMIEILNKQNEELNKINIIETVLKSINNKLENTSEENTKKDEFEIVEYKDTKHILEDNIMYKIKEDNGVICKGSKVGKVKKSIKKDKIVDA